jgi:hypothetical protein
VSVTDARQGYCMFPFLTRAFLECFCDGYPQW